MKWKREKVFSKSFGMPIEIPDIPPRPIYFNMLQLLRNAEFWNIEEQKSLENQTLTLLSDYIILYINNNKLK